MRLSYRKGNDMDMLGGVIGAVIVLTVIEVWEGLRRWIKRRLHRRVIVKEQKEKAYYTALSSEERRAYLLKPYHHSLMTRLREWLNRRLEG